MRVLVDTPIWSEALRRNEAPTSALRDELQKLIRSGVVELIGPVRQELLSGIRDYSKYEVVRERLRLFPDIKIGTEDYEEAASYYNVCRAKGIQGSSTDFLICAVACRNDLEIFTTDKDFLSYSTALPIRLHNMPKSA